MSRENIKYLFHEGRSINFYERMADFVRKSCKIQYFTLQWITILDTQYFDSFFFFFCFLMNFPFFFKFGEYEEYSMSYDMTAEFLKFRDLSNSYERNST